jgi:TolB-like protein
LIGPFGLFAPDGRRIEITSRKSVALIGLLALAPGGRRSREYLRSMLWCNADRPEAQASLRRELSNLRRSLKEQGCEHLLVTEMQRVSLDIDAVAVDIFSLGVAKADRRWAAESEFLEGLDLAGEEAFEDWLRQERQRVADLLEAELAAPESEQDRSEPAPPEPPAVRLPPRPKIAIAPFESLLPADDEWIATAISDDLTRRISHFPQLAIASGSSTRRMAERGMTSSAICRELGVAYLIEGRLLRVFDRIRVTVALVDGATGEQVWADSLDARMDELWGLAERLGEAIAPRIWSVVDLAERDRGLRSFGSPQSRYEAYWRTNALLRSWDEASIREASHLAEDMTRESPTCPWCASLAAYCNSIGYLMGYAPDRAAAHRRASLHSQTALRYGSENVEAIGYVAGTILNIGGDIDRAERLIERALTILPSFQPILFWGGWVDVARGDPRRASERFDLALRLNPASGARAQTLCGLGYAGLLMDEPAAALGHFEQADAEDPMFPLGRIGIVLARAALGEAPPAGLAATPDLFSSGAAFFGVLRREEDRAKLLSLLAPSVA